MSLRFYNTLTQQVEPFAPADGKTVRMYTCGPTVYHYVHIGNLRTFSFQDILRRWLHYRGFQLQHVMNITDVEDKIIRNAMQRNQTLSEYTRQYEEAFLEDMNTLRMQRPEKLVRATEHIHEMVEAIQQLETKGFTYLSDGSVYYRIANFPGYGKLSHIDFSGQKAGARVDVDEYDKDDARDFVLWKSRKDNEPYWDSPLGAGRPGWHIECSVMAMKYLGETLDIHTGGVDLTFPHHENEIAQSEAITGKPFARFWLHAEHLMVEGQKMAKSLGNFYTLRDLLAKGYPPEAIRYLLVQVPYRNKLNFTMDGLQGAAKSLARLRDFKLRLETSKFPEGESESVRTATGAASSAFDECMDDDLNTAGALGAVFDWVRQINTAMDSGEFKAGNAATANAFLAHFDDIFAVLAPTAQAGSLGDGDVEAKIAERTAAKKAKNFKLADEIRQQLLDQGIVLEDTKDGVRWKRK
ncbi:MAG: cysteine--tRNA ligase [Bryobacteraceae bacterium]